MKDYRLWLRGIVDYIGVLLFYAVTESLASAFADLVLYMRRLSLHNLGVIFNTAKQGAYLLWPFTHPNKYSWGAVVLTFMLAGFVAFTLFRVNGDARKKYKQRHGYAAYGTSHLQEFEEVQQWYHQDNNGIIIGDYRKRPTKELRNYKPLPEKAFQDPKAGSYTTHPWTSDLNQQYLVFGPPGSKKTVGFIDPNVFHLAQQGVSMVVSDPKPEIYIHTANYCRQLGYKVYVLDYLYFMYGQRQNLLQYVYDETHYAQLSNMFVSATRNEGDKRDFWEEQAEQLLTALIGFVCQVFGKKGTLTHVYDLIPYMANRKTALALFDHYKITGSPMKILRNILVAAKSQNTMASICTTLAGKLQLLAQNNVQAQTSASDFDLSRIADEKTIVYLWMSDTQTTYAPIISAFWTVLYNALYERARETGGALPNIVVPLMDEMGNIARIPDWNVKLATMRSRRIYPVQIWHNLPQLEEKYGKTMAQAILGTCDSHILLAANDMPTAKYFSEAIGKTTIETQSRRGARSINAELFNTSNQFSARDLLDPSEIKRMERVFSVVVQSGRAPVLLNKLQYPHWDEEERICDFATFRELPTYTLADANLPSVEDLFEGFEIEDSNDETENEASEENYSNQSLTADDILGGR